EIYASARAFMREQGNPNQWRTQYPSLELLSADIAEKRLYVCEEEGELLGVFYFALGEDPTYRVIEDGAWLSDKPYGVIHRIAVAARGRGVASFCFSHCFSLCPNIRIDTHRDNLPMQRALEKNGFHRCGIIHLENGDARIAYQKEEG
ncbi:MAG: GNAT family N-acetyltransferase, partial [Clostridia bacterium]|nr:GNAT family N-acetyltransferase [Clostridia bacterium]